MILAAVAGWLLPIHAEAAAPARAWWSTNYGLRKKITITAGTVGPPNGYSVSLTFDHASLVGAGNSQADGDDIRIAYCNSCSGATGWVELDRVLDTGSSWNSSSTKIWFKTQAAISASASNDNYYLYYRNASAVTPPTNRANIYLFFDDFEAGNLNKWTASGLWAVATDQEHGGTYALKYTAETNLEKYIVANPALNEANVYVDAWWRVSNVGSTSPDVSQIFRSSSGPSQYETNLVGSSGWDIAKEISSTFTELNAGAGTPSANTWTRIGIGIYSTGMRVFKDGAQINPTSGSFNVGTELSSGNIGFKKYNISSGNAWWIDDVVARRYVDPEPTTALASAESCCPPRGQTIIGWNRTPGGKFAMNIRPGFVISGTADSAERIAD